MAIITVDDKCQCGNRIPRDGEVECDICALRTWREHFAQGCKALDIRADQPTTARKDAKLGR